MKKILLAILFALVFTCSVHAQAIQVEVIRVVDGDTLQVELNGKRERVRLIGVDTPETKHPRKDVQYFGVEAFEYTKNTLENRSVWLEFDIGQRDRYGRLLAYIWLEEPPANPTDQDVRKNQFNAHLLLNGYAQIMTIQPNVKYVDYFKEYQSEARDNKKGMWKD
jgi:Micrococcal nuclease (thermonuclease) homologs